jgi:hypothetical protein
MGAGVAVAGVVVLIEALDPALTGMLAGPLPGPLTGPLPGPLTGAGGKINTSALVLSFAAGKTLALRKFCPGR